MKIKLGLMSFVILLAACGKLPATTPTGNLVDGMTTAFTITAPNAPNSYNINGSENPSLTVKRGQTYTFSVNTPGHPFFLAAVQGTNMANAFTDGVSGNGTQSGTVTFVVPSSAPSTLFYDCALHSGMTGVINVTN